MVCTKCLVVAVSENFSCGLWHFRRFRKALYRFLRLRSSSVRGSKPLNFGV